jgi:hypothetical protein
VSAGDSADGQGTPLVLDLLDKLNSQTTRRLSGLCDNFSDALFPVDDRRTHFVHVGVTIVDGGHAGDRPRDVVEQFLGHVDRRAERCEVCRERATKYIIGPQSASLGASIGAS